MSQAKHSLIGASSAYRWMECPGSPALIAKAPPQRPSAFAAEGTAAHKLAQVCLETSNNAHRYLGTAIEADGMTFEVTEEMVEAVQLYLDIVREARDCVAGRKLLVEHTFDLSHIFRGMFGTNDAIVMDAQKLIVYDFKYGKGVTVEIVDNKQLLYYALGALDKLAILGDFEEIELVIVQPRAEHRDGPVRSWTIDAAYLRAFAKELEKAARATADDGALLKAGDHCHWCPALAICPEVAKKVKETALVDFTNVPVPGQAVVLPAPHELSMEQVKAILDMAELADEYIRSVQQYAEDLARRGINVPGYKLVKKRSNRAWVDEAEVEAEFKATLGEKIYTAPKLLSPAQIEKVIVENLGKKKKEAEFMVDLFTQTPDAGVCLVKESDKRAAVTAPMIEDFTNQNSQ